MHDCFGIAQRTTLTAGASEHQPLVLLSYRRHEHSSESEFSLSCSFAREAPAQPQMTTCVLPETASRTACVQVLLPLVSASPSPCNPTHGSLPTHVTRGVHAVQWGSVDLVSVSSQDPRGQDPGLIRHRVSSARSTVEAPGKSYHEAGRERRHRAGRTRCPAVVTGTVSASRQCDGQ